MKRFLISLCAIAVTFVPASASPPDGSQIQSLFNRFATAFRSCDLNGVMSFYVHDDSLFAFDFTPPLQHVGWNDYRNDRRDFFLEMKPPISFNIKDLRSTISGDVAYTHSIQQIAAPMINGGTLRLRLRVSDVLRKINGHWLIVEEHVSVPIDLATGAAVLSDL